jgi:prolyl oligopeptidase
MIFVMSSDIARSDSLTYPPAARSDHVDVCHGVTVADPYRWMENVDSPQTRAWVEAEDTLTSDYLAKIPGRDAIARRLTELQDFEQWTAPSRHGKNWFYWHNSGLQNQPVLFATDNPEHLGRVLIDPDTLSKDGTISIRAAAATHDGTLVAYSLSEAGSDRQTWHVRDVARGRDLPDQLRWSKAGGATWRKDASGFYYTAYDAPRSHEVLKAPNHYQKLLFHKLGTPQSDDKLIYTRTDAPDWYINAGVTYDGRYLVIRASRGTDLRTSCSFRISGLQMLRSFR